MDRVKCVQFHSVLNFPVTFMYFMFAFSIIIIIIIIIIVVVVVVVVVELLKRECVPES